METNIHCPTNKGCLDDVHIFAPDQKWISEIAGEKGTRSQIV